jgi:hypothetical protein
MRRLILSMLVPACLLVGCGASDEVAEEQEALHGHVASVPPPGPDDVAEAVFFRGSQCHMVFRDVSSPEAETFFIWNLGVDGVLQEEAYPTLKRANLYAIFAPGPPDSVHHVDGEDAFDHYHIVDAAPREHGLGLGNRYDGTWDVFLVFTGPRFDAATYQAARSVREMFAQIRDGILGPVTKTTDAGFGPLVLHAEIFDDCDDGHDAESR